ncbi:MAG: hypothetical protein QXJ17_00510 [Nitrososphaeria archaeon]
MQILKTVVGSFPKLRGDIEESIKRMVEMQLKHNIDIVSDGEQRSDMIGYFDTLPGLGRNNRGVFIRSKVEPIETPKEHIKLHDFRFVRNYLDSLGKWSVPIKVTITGPITLGFSCALNGLSYYRNIGDLNIYYDFARALSPLIEEVARNDCYLQIDEPSLSSRVIDSKKAVKFVNESIKNVTSNFRDNNRLSVHICGPLNEQLLSDFMSLDAPVLSLAFSAHNVRNNLKVVSKQMLEAHNKRIGAGCVSVQATTIEEVEGEEVVKGRLLKLYSKIGLERILYIHPDCGFRSTSLEASELILERMDSTSKTLLS